MKRKYEFKTKTPGLTLQVEESECPDTATLSVIYHREEVLVMCLTRADWAMLCTIGGCYGSDPAFAWTPAPETNPEVTK